MENYGAVPRLERCFDVRQSPTTRHPVLPSTHPHSRVTPFVFPLATQAICDSLCALVDDGEGRSASGPEAVGEQLERFNRLCDDFFASVAVMPEGTAQRDASGALISEDSVTLSQTQAYVERTTILQNELRNASERLLKLSGHDT